MALRPSGKDSHVTVYLSIQGFVSTNPSDFDLVVFTCFNTIFFCHSFEFGAGCQNIRQLDFRDLKWFFIFIESSPAARHQMTEFPESRISPTHMTINRNILTLEEFRKQELRSLPAATGELSNLLRDIALAAKRVNVEVNKAGLVDILGETGSVNIQGESVQKLDEFANAEFMAVLQRGISCAGIASEEMDEFVAFDETLCNQSKYIVVMDPLDGSSNIDVNLSIGTIFGVYRRKSGRGTACVLEDFLQEGKFLVAAGYIIYGSSTMMVYATRRGVNGFTLDPSIGEFTLSHPDIRCPESGRIYSVNYGNFFAYGPKVQRYIECCQQKTKAEGGPYSLRYTGSLVADLHRNMLRGGLFMYPETKASPEGKLRLVYECNPFAFILEVAGGLATDGQRKILESLPVSLHQRTAFFAGSRKMMTDFI